jgi:hypothetical protein
VSMAATSAGKRVVERPAKERDQSSDGDEEGEDGGVGRGSTRPVFWRLEMGSVGLDELGRVAAADVVGLGVAVV